MRKRYGLYTLLCLSLLGAAGCSTDFEVNEPEREIDIVYGLLDAGDSTRPQYIKINKAFLNEDSSVYVLAKDVNKIHHTDTLDVLLEELAGSSSSVVSSTTLVREFNDEKEPGIFANPGQYLYRTEGPGFRINPKSRYRLSILNKRTGVRASSETEIVAPPRMSAPQIGRAIRLQGSENGLNPVYVEPGDNGHMYDVTLRVFYDEYMNGDTTTMRHDSIDWNWKRGEMPNRTVGGESMRFGYTTPEFLYFLAGQIPKDPRAKRRFVKIDIHIDVAGKELANYIQIMKPSIGIVQKRNDYTNIQNGYGIFSSRILQKHTIYLDASSKQLIRSNTITKELNFE